MAKKLPAAVTQAVERVNPLLSAGGRTMAERLQAFVVSTTRSTAARLAV